MNNLLNKTSVMIESLSKNQKMLLIVMLLVVLKYLIFGTNAIFGCNNDDNNKVSDYKTQWINDNFGYGYGTMNPSKELIKLVEEFGKPSIFVPSSNGLAIWTKNDLVGFPYERIEIHDQQIPSDKPVSHTNFVYVWYKMDVAKHKMVNFDKISENITYDIPTKSILVRSYDITSAIVSLWITKKYVNDVLTLDEAVGMFGPMNMELINDDKNKFKKYKLISELS